MCVTRSSPFLRAHTSSGIIDTNEGTRIEKHSRKSETSDVFLSLVLQNSIQIKKEYLVVQKTVYEREGGGRKGRPEGTQGERGIVRLRVYLVIVIVPFAFFRTVVVQFVN